MADRSLVETSFRRDPCPFCNCPGERFDGHACEDFIREVVQEYMERISATFDVERISNVFAERSSAGEQRRSLERALGRFVYESRHDLGLAE